MDNEVSLLLANIDRNNNTLLATFKELVDKTPLDNNGFVIYILDYRHIPANLLSNNTQSAIDKYVNIAKLHLSMREGFISTQFGEPIWDKFSYEAPILYEYFQTYLTSANRNLSQILPSTQLKTMQELEEIYTFYYWEQRAKIFDIFLPIARSKGREFKRVRTEKKHFKFAENAIDRITEELNNRKRPLKKMATKELLDSVIKLSEMQRIAIGLPAKGVKTPTHQELSPVVSNEANLENSADRYNGKRIDQIQTSALDEEQKIKTIVANSPEDTLVLQELALKIYKKANQEKQEEK